MPTLCPKCGGKGMVRPPPNPCSKCDGRGYTVRIKEWGAEQLATLHEDRPKCTACNGTGKITVDLVPCDWCDRTGQVKVAAVPVRCPQCSGVGVVPGPEKYPSGLSKSQIACPTCNGEKTVLQNQYVPDRS
jgi:DnaJ-class molecular chaperone